MHSCSLRLLRSSFVLCFNNILEGSASKQPELAQNPCEEVTVLVFCHSFIHSFPNSFIIWHSNSFTSLSSLPPGIMNHKAECLCIHVWGSFSQIYANIVQLHEILGVNSLFGRSSETPTQVFCRNLCTSEVIIKEHLHMFWLAGVSGLYSNEEAVQSSTLTRSLLMHESNLLQLQRSSFTLFTVCAGPGDAGDFYTA